jgi:hypothetical protein
MNTYAFFDVTELPKVDFSRVNETSFETLRYSLDGSKTFIHWGGDNPSFITELTCDVMTEVSAIELLSKDEWTPAWWEELERLTSNENNDNG